MHLCIFEDPRVNNFLPLVHFRPVFDLRSGYFTTLERILRYWKSSRYSLIMRRNVAEYYQELLPGIPVNDVPDDDLWLVNGRVSADETLGKILRTLPSTTTIFRAGEDITVAFIRKRDVARLKEGFPEGYLTDTALSVFASSASDLRLFRYSWDLVNAASDGITRDYKLVKKGVRARPIRGIVDRGAHLLNNRQIVVGSGSRIKAGAVLDAEKGPIIIGEHVTVMSNAVLEGPVSIGDHSLVKVGAKIYHGTAIGPYSKVGGEIEASVIQSYTNKQHDGFLGHSYLGSWVNLGADTNTSDLKNTYGNIGVYVYGELVDTGLQFVGLTMGDHSKSGINLMFDTGSVVGVNCNIYGFDFPPKYLPSFSWGTGTSYTTYHLEKSLETMRRVMARRDIRMSAAYERMVRNVFAATAAERKRAGIGEA